jgi:hypothetical protein
MLKGVIVMKKYQHYKGHTYEFITEAIHSETDEKLVIYKNKDGQVFARPFNMFHEKVEKDGKLIPRFKEIDSE